ncbi:MAG: hypothetical protein LBJ10_08185 [Clostridiales bacterium]|jgi:cobalamin biosynthesis protein CobD/CbiB|nr:hypothetical protein [Clostridiales bacterium]
MKISEWLSVSPNTVFCIFAAWLVELVIGRPRFVPDAAGLLGAPACSLCRWFAAIAERLCAKKPDKADFYGRAAGAALCAYAALLVFAVSAVAMNLAAGMGVAPYSLLNVLCLYSALSTRQRADGLWQELGRLRKAESAESAEGCATASAAAGARASAGASAKGAAAASVGAGANGGAFASAERGLRMAIEDAALRSVRSFAAPLAYMAAGAFVGMPAPFALAYSAVCALGGAYADQPLPGAQPGGGFGGQGGATRGGQRDGQHSGLLRGGLPGGSPGGSFGGLRGVARERFAAAVASFQNAVDYAPARILCATLPFAAMACGKGVGGFKRSVRAIRRDSGNSFDPNSALILSAYAGALIVRLGGDDGGYGYGYGHSDGSRNVGDGSCNSCDSNRNGNGWRSGSDSNRSCDGLHSGGDSASNGGSDTNGFPAAGFAVGDDGKRPEAGDLAFAIRLAVASSACVFAICLAAMLLFA